MSRYGGINYQRTTKLGFLLSIAIFAIGAGAELSAAAMHVSLLAWQDTLFTDMEIVGTLGALLVPLLFGIILPLTE